MNLKTKPYQHQEAAFIKLKDIKAGALFMDTGTGKNRTALELIDYRLKYKSLDKVFWICPVPTKKNLADDIKKHSSYSTSYIESFKNEFICVVGIETISLSDKYYSKLLNLITLNSMLIIDESHLIKNPKSKRSQRILALRDKINYRIIMTGTPVTQGVWDLFTQMYFLHPGILGYHSFYSFAKNHLEYSKKYPGLIVRAHNIDYLTKKINPYIYQIKKDECLDLPEKNYQVRYFELSLEHRLFYNDVRDILFNEIDFENLKSVDIFKMIGYLHRVASGYINTEISLKKYDFMSRKNKKIIFSYENLDRVKILKEVLSEINLDENKCIIWHRYESDLEAIEKQLKGLKYSKLNGKMNKIKKEIDLDKFQNGDNNILVSNIGTGAVGLNLQVANYIIYYNNTFDYGKRYQSEDRIYRIGQNKNCHIIDIVADNTIDVRVKESLDNKESLANSIKRAIDKIKNNKEYIVQFKKEFLNIDN
ncbi:DEAD/DEAH box helicase [Clostridioides difficile]|uniref:DEAD/DEAH box helicase n=1 Tax=Clostridioides difficile TaxID=1496 RepID=UPI001033A06A|nr:DEAD/DEAH box helicase [Clostridioides difficile]MDM9944024.1 DEAD/DEAH box helicase [Clostridioides difficile]